MASKTMTVVIAGQATGAKQAAQQTSTAYGALAAKMAVTGAKMAATGKKMTIGLTLPILAAGVASFKLASDLNESMNKAGVVFKKNAGQVKDWSKTSADAMGLSRAAALEG